MGFNYEPIVVNKQAFEEYKSREANADIKKYENTDVKSVDSNINSSVVEEVDLSTVAAGIGLFGDKYYGHKDFETLEELELKKEKDLDDIGHFKNLNDLSLTKCNLENSNDLGKLPDSVETIRMDLCEISDYSSLSGTNVSNISIDFPKTGINLSDFSNSNIKDLSIHAPKGEVTGRLSGNYYLESIELSYTNIKDLDCISDLTNLRYVDINHNLLDDVSALYDSNIERLHIEGNSVNELDLSRFPNLKYLYIEENYNLYTQEILDYCNLHDIEIDIDQEDVNLLNQVRSIIDSLDLEGRTDLEKESIIYSYVLHNMDYKISKVKDSNEEPIKTALDGVGVCAGYAAFFKALCDCAGLNCYKNRGYGKGGLIFGGPHGWNMVEIDGQYYLCDPTWSDGVREGSIFDHRVWIYKAKSLWHKIFGDDDLEVEDQYYNRTGKDAKKFIKKHREYTDEGYNKRDFLYQNEEALNEVSLDTSSEEGQDIAINTAISSVFPNLSGIRSIDTKLKDKLITSYSNE